MTLQDWLVDVATAEVDVTDAQLDAAADAVHDLAGVAVLGSTAPSVERVRRFVAATGGQGDAVVFGRPDRVDPVSAALLNGSAAQAFDFDDIAPACVSHVSAIMVPTVVAVLDAVDAEEALHGYVRGLMVISRLGEAFTHHVYDRGIQPTHTMGPLGGVTALLHAFGADADTARAAFGLVATQMIGLRAHTGTRYKAVQSGMVAAAAVRSVLLAREGVEAGDDAVDVVMRLMGITDEQLTAMQRDEPLEPVALATKWYPTCGAAHTAIEATVEVRRQCDGRLDEPGLRLHLFTPPQVMTAMEFPQPANPDEARFSVEYCMATAWATGGVTPGDFAPEAIARPEVRAVMDLIDITVDDALSPPPNWSGSPAIVRASWDGRPPVEASAPRPLGYPERALTAAQLEEKFTACVAPVYGADLAHDAFPAIQGTKALTEATTRLSG